MFFDATYVVVLTCMAVIGTGSRQLMGWRRRVLRTLASTKVAIPHQSHDCLSKATASSSSTPPRAG